MTLLQEIENLTWHNGINKVKSILKRLLTLVSNNTPTYKVYSALLTQTSTNNPQAIVLENTLGIVPTYIYDEIGKYRILAPNTFIYLKTSVSIANNAGASTDYQFNNAVYQNFEDENQLFIETSFNGESTNSNFNNGTLIEIKVYN